MRIRMLKRRAWRGAFLDVGVEYMLANEAAEMLISEGVAEQLPNEVDVAMMAPTEAAVERRPKARKGSHERRTA